GLPSPAKVLNQPRNCRRSAWRRSCLRPPRRERLIEKSLAEDEGLADNLKSLLATLWHVHARATLNAVEPKGEATMMCGKSRRAAGHLLRFRQVRHPPRRGVDARGERRLDEVQPRRAHPDRGPLRRAGHQ